MQIANANTVRGSSIEFRRRDFDNPFRLLFYKVRVISKI